MEKTKEQEANGDFAHTNGYTSVPSKPSDDGDINQFDKILESIGSFGPRQRLIFILIQIAEVFGAFHMLLPVYVGAQPKWWDMSDNTTGVANLTVNDASFQNCSRENQLSGSGELVFHDDFTSIVSEWDLVCNYAFVSDMITSLQMVGLMIGALVCSQLSDLIGRKKSFYLGFFLMTIGGLLSGFAVSWQMYAACRLIVGVGFGGNMVVQVIYPMEFLGKKWRCLCGTVGCWAIGTIILAVIAYFIREWSLLTIVTSASGFVYFFAWLLIPESPRWLIQHGHIDEAEIVISMIAEKNGQPAPDLRELKNAVEAERENNQKKYTYFDLLKTPKYAKTAAIKFVAWFTVFVLYYTGSYNLKNFAGDRYFNVILSGLIDWAAMLSVIPTLTFMGRRKGNWMYLSIGLTMLLSIMFIFIAGKDEEIPNVILGLALVAKSAGLSGTYSVAIYSAELFPTAIRNIGVGCGSLAARVGGIVAPQLVYLGTISQVAPYIITIALCLMVIPLLLLVPETKGCPLQDTFEEHVKTPRDSNNVTLLKHTEHATEAV